jgi:hypothetical protein
MTFQVQYMVGDEALVTGTDVAGNSGRTTVSTTQWNELQARAGFTKATEDFDKAVEEFFKPLTKAAKKAQKKMAASQEQDPISYVVIDEGIEGVEAKPRQLVHLSRDSIILRLIEEGDTDRLVWVDDSTLAILAKS